MAKVRHIEAVDAMNSSYPIESLPTSKEVKALLAANASRKYLVFPEDPDASDPDDGRSAPAVDHQRS